MRFMQTESVLQTKNRSGPAKNWFSVALLNRRLFSLLFGSKCQQANVLLLFLFTFF